MLVLSCARLQRSIPALWMEPRSKLEASVDRTRLECYRPLQSTLCPQHSVPTVTSRQASRAVPCIYRTGHGQTELLPSRASDWIVLVTISELQRYTWKFANLCPTETFFCCFLEESAASGNASSWPSLHIRWDKHQDVEATLLSSGEGTSLALAFSSLLWHNFWYLAWILYSQNTGKISLINHLCSSNYSWSSLKILFCDWGLKKYPKKVNRKLKLLLYRK